MLENDEERFSAGREKFYLFMKIPKEVEKFMLYGVLHCIDSFLFVYTYLPVRVVLALWALITRPLSKCFGLVSKFPGLKICGHILRFQVGESQKPDYFIPS